MLQSPLMSLPQGAPPHPPPDAVAPDLLRRALRRWHSPDLGRTELARELPAVRRRLDAQGQADGLLARAEALRSHLREAFGAMREAGHGDLAEILERQYARQDALMTIADDLAIGERGFFKRQRQAVETLGAILAAGEAAAAIGDAPSGADADEAPLPSGPPPFQAPPLPRWWVGREGAQELLRSALDAALPEGRTRLVGIVGMGGLGKSSLANRLAHTLADGFPDGVLWLDMAGLDLGGALQQVADAFGQAERLAGAGERAARASMVRGLLNARSALLVLDDVQQDDQVASWLPSTASSAVILTSRRADLALLQGATTCRLGPLPPAESTALLVQAIGAARVAEEPEAAAALLAQCEHLPLAMDLAARLLAQRPQWTLAALAARLAAKRPDTLVWNDERVIERSVDTSWQQLDPSRQRFLAVLTLFAEEIDPAAAAAAAAEALDDWAAGEWLEQLADRSLVLRTGGPGYRLHPMVRDFLDRRGPPPEARQALARYYSARMLAEEQRLAGPHSREAIGWYDAELLNIEGLRGWALGQPEDAAARELVLTCGSYATAYFERRTRFELWRRWSEDGLAASLAGDSAAQRGACRRQLGILAFRAGDLTAAERLLAEARQDLEAVGDTRGLAAVNLAELALAVRRGRWAEAGPLGAAGLEGAEAAGDTVLQARLHYLLGLAHARVGETEPAIHHHRRAAALAEAAGDAVDAGYAHGALAEMSRRVGRIAEGIDHARRAVTVALELGDLRRLSRGRDALGELYLAAGDLDHASTVYTLMVEEALPYADLEPSDLVAARIGVGRVATLRGEWEAARASLEEAAALSAARGDAYLEGESLRYLAELHLAHGPAHHEDAADCAARAHQLHADHGRQYAAERARQTLVQAMGSEEEAAERLRTR